MRALLFAGVLLLLFTTAADTQAAGSATLSLVTADVNNQPGDTIVVDIKMTGASTEVLGGQFFLEYDTDALQYESITTGDAPFTVQVYKNDSVNGQLDYAVGVPQGDKVGTKANTVMARITFTAIANPDICKKGELVKFRTHTPPTRLTDNAGVALTLTLNNLNPLTIDSTPPVITCPNDIAVQADAGTCEWSPTAPAEVMTFDSSPLISSTQQAGYWYTDRYAPAGFVSEFCDGDWRLQHSINEADKQTNQFNNTQGRKYDIPGTRYMAIDLIIPADWADTGRRMAGLWGTAMKADSTVAAYPIIEFASNPVVEGGPNKPRFQVWHGTAGWVDIGLPTDFEYGEWYTLEIELVGSKFVFRVGDLVNVNPTEYDAVEIGNVILQGYNTTEGVTYDICWDNFKYSSVNTLAPPTAIDNCDLAPVFSYERDDGLALSDPYPIGDTIIIWTATDASGNTSLPCEQTVTVNDLYTAVIEVELEGVNVISVSRWITFQFGGTDGAGSTYETDRQVTFYNGTGIAEIDSLPACYNWTCVTAKDEQHTLRSKTTLDVDGIIYTASFTGTEKLLGGDLSNDNLIDILDFGIFAAQFGTSPPLDTTWPILNADISCSGLVDAADYTYIQQKFLKVGESLCGGAGTMSIASTTQPRTAVSVYELAAHVGLSAALRADMNRDGIIDARDVSLFLSSIRGPVRGR